MALNLRTESGVRGAEWILSAEEGLELDKFAFGPPIATSAARSPNRERAIVLRIPASQDIELPWIS